MCHRALKTRYVAIIVFICSLAPAVALGEVLLDTSITISETYNSNPLSRSKDQNVDDDYITTLSPRIKLTNKQRNYSLNTSYTMSSTTYHEESANNDISHAAGAGITANISKNTSIRLRETFRAAKDSLSAIDEGIQTSRDDVTYNNVSLGIDHLLSPETSLTLGAAHSRSDFANPTLFDTMKEAASIGAIHRLSETGSTNVTYTYSKYLFDTANGTERTETHALSTGMKESLSPTLSLTLSGGLTYTPSISSDYDWTAGAKLAKSLKRTTAAIDYRRSISNSSGLSEEINVKNTVKGSLKHNLAESVALSLSGAFTKSRSKPSGAVDLDSYTAKLSVSWRPYTWLASSVGYSKFKQLAVGASTLNIDTDQAYLSLTFTPGQWRI